MWHLFLYLQRQSRNCFYFIPVIVVILGLSGCSSLKDFWRQIPVQIARVEQTDSFTQSFLISGSKNPVHHPETPEENRILDERMDIIFINLIGAKNWQHLKNLYGVDIIRKELSNNEIRLEGHINFTGYIDPYNLNFIIIEGFGRYFAIRDLTGTILMSGDLYITPQRYNIEQLKSGCIPLESNVYTTRIPGKPTYYNKALLQYDLLINLNNPNEDTISLDYHNPHYGYIDLNNDNEYTEDELYAAIKLNSRYHHAKIIDLSGLTFVKKDYKSRAVSKLEAIRDAQSDKARSCVKDKTKAAKEES